MTDLLRQRIEIGRKAREIIALAEDEGGDDSHFWSVIRDEAIKRAPLQQPKDETHIRPMTDADGERFSREVLGFGAYVDCTYEHVYLCGDGYLDWLADHGMQLLRWLAWRKSKL